MRACGATSCPNHGLKAVVLIAVAFTPKEIKRERAAFIKKTFVCLQRGFLKMVASFPSCSRADAQSVVCATPQVFMLRSGIDPFYSNSVRNSHSMSEGLKMSLYTELCTDRLHILRLFGLSHASKRMGDQDSAEIPSNRRL